MLCFVELEKTSTGNKMPVFASTAAWSLPGALGDSPGQVRINPIWARGLPGPAEKALSVPEESQRHFCRGCRWNTAMGTFYPFPSPAWGQTPLCVNQRASPRLLWFTWWLRDSLWWTSLLLQALDLAYRRMSALGFSHKTKQGFKSPIIAPDDVKLSEK